MGSGAKVKPDAFVPEGFDSFEEYWMDMARDLYARSELVESWSPRTMTHLEAAVDIP